MREQKSLWLLLALNVVFAGGFLTYLFLAAGKPASPPLIPSDGVRASHSQQVAALQSKNFSWEQIGSERYTNYLSKLREAGCPETRIQQIVLSDIEDYFAQKRLQLALSFDVEWWRDEPMDGAVEFLHERGQNLEEQREELMQKLLGGKNPETQRESAGFWQNIQLTGPVLGRLPPAIHQQVQEICARSVQEQETLAWTHAYDKEPIPAVTLARLRDQARAELRKILSAEQMEEFLLRFSHNAQELRAELRSFEPTADEFRKIFRAIDPIEQELQQQYGDVDALSRQQQERHQHQREEAIREALGTERFQAYLASKNRLSSR